MSGQNRTKADIFLREIPIKFLEINGRIVPLIGGASEDSGADYSGQNEPQNGQNQQDGVGVRFTEKTGRFLSSTR